VIEREIGASLQKNSIYDKGVLDDHNGNVRPGLSPRIEEQARGQESIVGAS
jgi:hypothetical protein